MSDKHATLFTLKGAKQPGLCTAVSQLLAQHDVDILKIDQQSSDEQMTLQLMLDSAKLKPEVLGELISLSTPLGLDYYVDGTRLNSAEVGGDLLLTLMGRSLPAEALASLCEALAEQDLQIHTLKSLSDPALSGEADGRAVVEMQLIGQVDDLAAMQSRLQSAVADTSVDLALQSADSRRVQRGLICFDMDSTLIQAEVIDELAARTGIGEQVAAITESAMRGEIDFNESFRRRMGLLKGLREDFLAEVADSLPITEGAARLIYNLRVRGYKVAILSGGFTYFAQYLAERLGVDYIHANVLDFQNGELTGEVSGEIINGERKAHYLQALAEQNQLTLEQVVAVGDGANDLPMLGLSGLGVAFHAKPLVQEKARFTVNQLGLDAVLYLLGLSDEQILDPV